LRAGLDEFLRANAADLNTRLFYFPSYEILLNLFTDPWREDNRHPQRYVIDTIMHAFEAAYCRNATTVADANAMFQRSRASNLAEVIAVASGATPSAAAQAARDQRRADRKALRRADRERSRDSMVED
jgi:hypothetical protein